MKLNFSRCFLRTLAITPMLFYSLCQAELNSPAFGYTSLAQPNRGTTYFGIAQFGMPGDDKYVLCDERDCQRRTTKHIYVAEVTKLPPLTMPDPVVAQPAEEVARPAVEPIVKPKKKSAQKPARRKSVNCVVEK